jgi:chromosome segregation ATPase
MIITKKKKDDARARIRDLFEARDRAKQAHAEARRRIGTLEGKAADLQAALPGLQEALKAAEYQWRLALGRQEAGEASAEDVFEAEKGIDDATRAITVNRETLAGVEDLLGEAQNKLPGLSLHAEHAGQAPWRAIATEMEAAAREAATTLERYRIARLNGDSYISPTRERFFEVEIPPLSPAATSAEIEEEYRK